MAVIGPNSDQWLMLLGNYNGVPSKAVTPLQGIKDKLPNSKVLFAQGCELSEGMPMFYTVPAEVLKTDGGQPGIKVDYFNNKDLSGSPLYSSVEKIVSALSELENDIESLSVKVQDMKKRIISTSDNEIAQLREKIIQVAKTHY